MGEIFYWVLNISILGSAAGLIVLLLRRFKRLPRFGVYLLWLLPLARFWLPAGLSSRYSLLGLLPRYAVRTVDIWVPGPGSPALSMTNSLQAAGSYFPFTFKTDLLKNLFNIAGLVWLIIAAAAVLCAVLLYFITKSALRDAVHEKDNIYRSDKILSPAVYGIFKPKIILPAGLDATDLLYILAHERLHVKRRDNVWRVAAIITACVHWFNPLAWLLVKAFFTDMELACDAGVLKTLDGGGKKAYAAALLSCAAGKTGYASAFGGAKVRLRIETILSYKKLTLVSGLCFAALLAAVAVTVLTNTAG